MKSIAQYRIESSNVSSPELNFKHVMNSVSQNDPLTPRARKPIAVKVGKFN